MAIATINPATGETLRTFTPLDDAAIDAVLDRAELAYSTYPRTSFADRAGWLNAAADILDRDRAEIAAILTQEMGKPIVAAEAEVAKCALVCRYYADNAEAMLVELPADAAAMGASRAYTRWDPLGIVLAVMPWNFPLWQVFRFLAPAMMAGNVGLLKHASNVPQTALRIEAVVREAGFPDDVFQTLLIGAGPIERILTDPRVVAATLTGSEGAGRSVASIAGRALKKTVLELGGSDPFVVLPSADIDAAVALGVKSRCQNNGQSCIAAKRFIVHQDVAAEFTAKFVAAMAGLRIGDPADRDTEIGPIATEQGRVDIEEIVDDAIAKGAEVLTGGRRLDGPGYYYPPTVVTAITKQMRLYAEEVFGPVASLYVVADNNEALSLANDSVFGLGSAVWTTDPAEQEFFVAGIEAGAVTVNGMTTSYPQLPFGGIKLSGYGRELAALGIREFCNAKSVWVG